MKTMFKKSMCFLKQPIEHHGLSNPCAVEDVRWRERKLEGFSLIEITVAIGIVAFSFISILGLIPVGLNRFHAAIDTSVSKQIFQRLVNEAGQTDYSALVGTNSVVGSTFRSPQGAGNPAVPSIRYFDSQGNEVIPATTGTPHPAEKARIVYWVNTRIMVAPELPGAAAGNSDIAMVTMQVVNNPGNSDLDIKLLESGGANDTAKPLRNLWKSGAGFAVSTHSIMIARNK